MDDVLDSILEGAKSVGFIRDWGGKRYLDLAGIASSEAIGARDRGGDSGYGEQATAPIPSSAAITSQAVSVQPGIHINIEIHIAADASSDTIEEIFRNMRRYVLAGGSNDDDVARAMILGNMS